MASTTPTETWAISRTRRADEIVLATHELKPGTEETSLSRFIDDRWDLAPAIFRENVPRSLVTVDFTNLEDPWQQLTAKEFIWARMNEASPLPTQARLAPTMARATLHMLSGFMAFVAHHAGRFAMHLVDQALLDAYLAEVKRQPGRTPERIAHIIDVPLMLDRYGRFLTLGSFSCRPWRGRPAVRVAGVMPRPMTAENRTPRIPEPVIGAMLRWSLKYIDVFAEDIFAARAALDRLEQARKQARNGMALSDRLDIYIGRRCGEGRGIPVRTTTTPGQVEPGINFHLIGLQLGCHARHLIGRPLLRRRLERALARLGGEVGGLDSPIAIDPDTGRPWRERFDGRSLEQEERMLQAAAYIVCAYLTGMRDSELQAMRVGCLSTSPSADGLIDRHRITSTVYKSRTAAGEEAEWVTIAPVARAIDIAERLSRRQRDARGAVSIWQTLAMDKGNEAELRGGTLALINNFRAHLDAQAGQEPAIPHMDGRPWWFTSRQFRRTLAWHIANRPFGTVAGKIQYKHASVAIFEGYAGSSPSGFRIEVEQERALGQLDDVVSYYEDTIRRGLPPTGPAAARLRREFEHICDKLGDLPGRIVDSQRLRAMLAHLGRTLHVGLLADCFFDPDTALCLDREEAPVERSAPALSHCRPDRCPNACITRRHLAPWQASIAEGERMLGEGRLSPLQRQALLQDNERKRSLIAPLIEGGPQ
ncbi:hypothetical protein EOA86_02340 [Mesorhizobium sp. M5C.F.Ca.IN.020.32.2.1]|nr:hypothetical protein EOA86_02340 [Mesorhizobium sp. M5C.F.Ca.IN.020.32.2.1]